MNIKRKRPYQVIKPPKYRVGKYVLNEYELRQLQVDVMNGQIEAPVTVKDEKGASFTIGRSGRMSGSPYGYNFTSKCTLELLSYERNLAKSQGIITLG